MFSHVTVGSNDLERSRRFYDALFGAVGAGPGKRYDDGWLEYARGNAFLFVLTPVEGSPATAARGGTIGFRIDSPEAVDAWHKAGCENGGTTIEKPPGVRGHPAGTIYLAYLRDPDGNRLCGLHRAVG